MRLDRKYLVWGLVYVAVGMGMGIFMAASHDHTQHVTHAHVLLIGFVISFIYAVIHKLWLGERATLLGKIQFYAHQTGALLMFLGLFMLYGDFMPPEQVEPLLAPSTIVVFVAALLMIVMVARKPAR